jgi:hypothetical protein
MEVLHLQSLASLRPPPGDDHGLSTPEPYTARILDSASQRTVSRLGAHSPLPDAPRESTRFKGCAPDAVPRQLCRRFAGPQRRLAQRMRGLRCRLGSFIPGGCFVCIIRGSMHPCDTYGLSFCYQSAIPQLRFMPRWPSRCLGNHDLKRHLLS